MRTKIELNMCKSFSDIKNIIIRNSLNESLGDVANGAGMFFSPLPGFILGSCGPMQSDSSAKLALHYDEPVFAAMLLFNGKCSFAISELGYSPITLQKGMLIVGYWDNIMVDYSVPKQKSYKHLGFYFTKTALENYCGKSAAKNIKELINSKANSLNTIAGKATPHTIIKAQEMLAATRDITITSAKLLGLRGMALDSFVMLVKNIESFGSCASVYPPHEIDMVHIAKLKEHINKNFLTIDGLKDINRLSGMSFSKANTLFKMKYNCSLAQYIHECKMEYAYSILASHKSNVTECAIDIGYSNISQFITSFKKRYHVTPKMIMNHDRNLFCRI